MKNTGLVVKKIITATVSLLLAFSCFSQSPITASQAAQKLSEIYNRFDSMLYISFDTRTVLQSDTLDGNSSQTEEKGKFTVAGKKCYQAVGDVEMLQTDSLVIAVYKTAKVMLLNRATSTGAGNIMQGSKPLLDSVTTSLAASYNMFSDTTEHGDTSLVQMYAIDSLQPHKKIEIIYSSLTKELISVSYDFYGYMNEDNDAEDDSTTSAVLRRQTITTYFENYRYDPESYTGVLSPGRFIHFDGEGYTPESAYAAYEFYDYVTRRAEENMEGYVVSTSPEVNSINGGQSVSPGLSSTSGTIHVVSPVMLRLTAYGGTSLVAGASSSIRILITGILTESDLYAEANQTNTRTIFLIPGNYSYTLSGTFVGTSGNSGSISF